MLLSALQILVGTLPVQEVQYNADRRVGLVVLGAGITRQQLEGLRPNLQQLQSQLGPNHLNGVIVTCQGMCQLNALDMLLPV